MFPSYPNNYRRPRRRSRPINPADTAATTGLFNNPNGTYTANPAGAGGYAGGQGQYGAMLPKKTFDPYNPLGLTYLPRGQHEAGFSNPLTELKLFEPFTPFSLPPTFGQPVPLVPRVPPQHEAGFSNPINTFTPPYLLPPTYGLSPSESGYLPPYTAPTPPTSPGFNNDTSLWPGWIKPGSNIPGFINPLNTKTTKTISTDTNIFSAQQAQQIRTAQAREILANGGYPPSISVSDAQAMGVTQDFIDAGYQMVNGQLVNPDTLTGQNSSFQYNNPGTGKAPTGPKSGYGAAWEGTESYGDGLRSKDSFENYKQNFRAQYGRDERRWWIGRGGGNGGNSGNRSADTIGLVNLNVGTG